MYKRTIIIFIISISYFQNTALFAASLDELSLSELSDFINIEATEKDLAGLARHQFYFVISQDYDFEIQSYQRLQKTLADKIPIEFERPVIDLKVFYGLQTKPLAEKTIGILGGMGPLSDANLLSLIHQKIKPQASELNVSIHLFSLPPPRTRRQQFVGGILYGARLTKFLNHSYAAYYLASNTAHVNAESIEKISSNDNLQNLVDRVANYVKSVQGELEADDDVMILGTEQAWSKRLYDDYFDRKDVAFNRLNESQQKYLQASIDAIKKGQWNDINASNLESWVRHRAEEYNTLSILLSCTELPLGLHDQIGDLEHDGFTVFNTEKLFADFITQDLVLLAAGQRLR
ncbi:MAG: aspartate/glutamate racemase family protein [Gammaproteobacteria bacterium]|nr:aspartate/glutamate racemase family protein [Gammaproteobacteria bacterium]